MAQRCEALWQRGHRAVVEPLIDPHYWKDQPLTLVLWDDLRISGYISEDGTEFVRTGAPDSPRSAAPKHDSGAMPYQRAKRGPRVQ